MDNFELEDDLVFKLLKQLHLFLKYTKEQVFDGVDFDFDCEHIEDLCEDERLQLRDNLRHRLYQERRNEERPPHFLRVLEILRKLYFLKTCKPPKALKISQV